MDDVRLRSFHNAADPTALDWRQQWPDHLPGPFGRPQSFRRGPGERPKPLLDAPPRGLAVRAEGSMLGPRQAISAEDHHAGRPDCVDPAPGGWAPHVGHEEDPRRWREGMGRAYLFARLIKVFCTFASLNRRWRVALG
jgi:hypothetical protein